MTPASSCFGYVHWQAVKYNDEIHLRLEGVEEAKGIEGVDVANGRQYLSIAACNSSDDSVPGNSSSSVDSKPGPAPRVSVTFFSGEDR